MDACHLLLGRPWELDRRVIHDGFLNTYSFSIDNHKFVLKPSPTSQQPTTANPVLMLQRSPFENMMREEGLSSYFSANRQVRTASVTFLRLLLNSLVSSRMSFQKISRKAYRL